MAKHLPRGRGYWVVRNNTELPATLIKWVRMNDRASIVMLKVRHPKKTKKRTPAR
jgi:hypothetical protein